MSRRNRNTETPPQAPDSELYRGPDPVGTFDFGAPLTDLFDTDPAITAAAAPTELLTHSPNAAPITRLASSEPEEDPWSPSFDDHVPPPAAQRSAAVPTPPAPRATPDRAQAEADDAVPVAPASVGRFSRRRMPAVDATPASTAQNTDQDRPTAPEVDPAEAAAEPDEAWRLMLEDGTGRGRRRSTTPKAVAVTSLEQSSGRAFLAKLSGTDDLGAQLAARKAGRTARKTGVAPLPPAEPSRSGEQPEIKSAAAAAWQVLSPRTGLRESWPVRARRWSGQALVVVALLAGVITISNGILNWIRPAHVAAAAAPTAPDVVLSGVAETVALDYLTWNATDQSQGAAGGLRAAALTRIGLPDGSADGWQNTGAETAQSAAVIGLTHIDPTHAAALVRVQLQPAAPTAAKAGATATPVAATWVSLAVALNIDGEHAALGATPALLGSLPDTIPLSVGNTTVDTTFTQATTETVNALMSAYGTGNLQFVRGSGTTFTGLNGAATLQSVLSWQATTPPPGADPTLRDGDVTVAWTLPGSAGVLTSRYHLQLIQQADRWLLQSITPETKDNP